MKSTWHTYRVTRTSSGASLGDSIPGRNGEQAIMRGLTSMVMRGGVVVPGTYQAERLPGTPWGGVELPSKSVAARITVESFEDDLSKDEQP